jgi:ElaB/YqjD/DUF883 family membrane-anchored ribosome-binding protein
MTGTNGTGDRVQEVSKEISELGRELRQKADDIRKETVKQLHSAAESIRKEAREASDSSEAHKAADEIAKGLERAAHFLNNRSVEQMGVEATRVVRRNPMRVMFVTFVVGLMLGMMMRGGDRK